MRERNPRPRRATLDVQLRVIYARVCHYARLINLPLAMRFMRLRTKINSRSAARRCVIFVIQLDAAGASFLSGPWKASAPRTHSPRAPSFDRYRHSSLSFFCEKKISRNFHHGYFLSHSPPRWIKRIVLGREVEILERCIEDLGMFIVGQ